MPDIRDETPVEPCGENPYLDEVPPVQDDEATE